MHHQSIPHFFIYPASLPLGDLGGLGAGLRQFLARQRFGQLADDRTELAKRVQRELFARLFDDRTSADEITAYVAQIVADLRAGRCDDELVYRRGLRKNVSEYTSNVPPHVQAVKKAM